MTAETAQIRTTLVTVARVRRSERISPAFVRVMLESDDFDELAPSTGFDARFKIIFPDSAGGLPPIPADHDAWYAAWQRLPARCRGPMRTYTIRDIVTEDGAVCLVVDFVVHEPSDDAGPACRWAMAAAPGDVVEVVVPHRQAAEHRISYGGVEFTPGGHRRVLIAGDETAVPAITRILADMDPGLSGDAFLEVPRHPDICDVAGPGGIGVHWLARAGRPYGRPLVDAVCRHLGLSGALPGPSAAATHDTDGVDIWETPVYSTEDDAIAARSDADHPEPAPLYSWIAGESWAVKTLRRMLVWQLRIPRADVAFMGYWRDGVAMKS